MSLVAKFVRLAALAAFLGIAAEERALAVEATLVADTHVNSARATANSGAISNLNAGGGYTALLQFDLGTVPAGTTASQVSRALLRLYCNRADTAGLVSVQPVTSGWGEYSVTYSSLPQLAATTQVVSVAQERAYVWVDVTTLVQGWITTPSTNNGLALTAGSAAVQFDSKENDLTGHAPLLDIVLASQGPAGPKGDMGAVGATGPAGTVGPAGPTGPQGLPGAKGDTGAQGPTGATGPVGLPGATGLQGPSGTQGATGPAGSPGLIYQGSYSATVNYVLGDVVLWQGAELCLALRCEPWQRSLAEPVTVGSVDRTRPRWPAGCYGSDRSHRLSRASGFRWASGRARTTGGTRHSRAGGRAGSPRHCGPAGIAGASWTTGPGRSRRDELSRRLFVDNELRGR